MMAEQRKPLVDLTEFEHAYLRLVRTKGHPAPTAKRLLIQKPVADDGETDCWTHAWRIARQIGGTYVEGVCRAEGSHGLSMHAWVVENNPLTGATLVEVTPGYERATHYIGIAIDSRPGGKVDELTADWHVRSSVIQAAFYGGWSPEQVLSFVRPG